MSRRTCSRLRAGIAVAAIAATTTVWAATPASAALVSAAGPLALAAAGCVESFDGLAAGNGAASLPAGAAFDESGANANLTYFAIDGSSNTGDTKSLGASGSPDRAFGAVQSGNLIPTLGVVVRNDTGATMTSLSVSYTLEQWRLGATGRNDRFDFSYSTSSTALTGGTYTAFTTLDGIASVSTGLAGGLDGNAAANRVVVSGTITGLSVPAAGTVLLRWTDFNATGADDALGIDDLAVVANGGAAPTAACSAPISGGSGTTRIHDVQGSGAVSPVAGQTKTIDAIVVGLDDLIGSSFGSGNTINTFPTDRGFFLQEEDADADADPATSEGVYVGLSSRATALPAIGDRVQVTGVVRDGQSPPTFGQTRIEASSFTVVSSGNPLPSLTTIDTTAAAAQSIGVETNPTRSYYETLEGMRVKLLVGVARSGGTNKFGELFLVPGTTGGTLLRTDPMPASLLATAADAGAGNPANPYDPPQPSSTAVGADMGDTVRDLVGPLAYSFGHYKVMPQIGAMPTIEDTGVAYPFDRLAPPSAGDRRIASFNLENFFPTGGALDGHIVSLAEFEEKRDRAADAIGRLLHAPDVVAVQEIGDDQHLGQTGTTTSLGTLQALATRLGQLGYGTYTAHVLEGNDNRGIDVGFLVKSTVTVIGAADQRGGLTAAGSCSDVSGRLFDRPPLFLNVDLGMGLGPVWIVSNHFSSKAAPDSCRIAQATWLRDQVRTIELAGGRVIVTGDLNAFEDEAALSTLQDGQTTLDNLRDGVPHDSAYSFQFGGVLQTLDHLLVTSGLAPYVAAFQYAHFDNDYFDRHSATDGHKVSDHDPPVLTLNALPPVVVSEAPVPGLLTAGAVVALALVGLGMRRRRSA